jgi:hypothetical protein
MKMLNGYKTYITGAMTLLGALGGFLIGNLSPLDAINLVVPAVLAMTVRNAIPKTTNPQTCEAVPQRQSCAD